jgi:8-oxo-dGTP pyrophosphatase MutT (NUDIX family)
VTSVPRDLPILERDVVRVVVRDSDDKVLLFQTHELTAPELGEWWELPGGGIDEGETYQEAAVRELWEEAGIVVSPMQLGKPTWRRTACFRHRNLRRLQHEVVVEARLDAPGSSVTTVGDWTARRRTTSTSAGGRSTRSSRARSGSIPAGFRRCCHDCWLEKTSTSRSSCGREPRSRQSLTTGTATSVIGRSPR